MVVNDEKTINGYDKMKEIEQEKLLLIEINEILTKQINEFQKIQSDASVIADKTKEIEQENIILSEITKQLEEKEVKLDDFFPNLSHELRTRLVPVQAYLEMLRLEKFGKINEVQSQKLDIINSSIMSLNQFITNILTSAKIELGQFVISKENCDLDKIITKAINITIPETKKSKTKIIYKKTSTVIQCDKQLILTVIVNLIQNSLNAVDEGEIEIVVSEYETEVLVEVKDNGTGISEDHISKIFDKFYKKERVLTQGGLGFGLYFCKQIIDIHGGRIWVSSKIGCGTTIHFTLPRSFENTTVSTIGN
jgi:signal transduction histidine kinase